MLWIVYYDQQIYNDPAFIIQTHVWSTLSRDCFSGMLCVQGFFVWVACHWQCVNNVILSIKMLESSLPGNFMLTWLLATVIIELINVRRSRSFLFLFHIYLFDVLCEHLFYIPSNLYGNQKCCATSGNVKVWCTNIDVDHISVFLFNTGFQNR